ncbi:MAG: cytochrome b/b6 domain-containing protein [Ignavibacteria bacterium]|nr:cytochrome b/b6 domain-containing protein [Ignavibacteria bacterium]
MLFENTRQSGKDRNVSRLVLLSFLILFLILNLHSDLFAQSKEDCLVCHEDESLTMEKEGREFSLFVNPGVLNKSTHNKLSCVSCHVGFNPDDLPHKENIQPIDCRLCHKDAPIKHQFHPQMMKAGGSNDTPDISCKNCHGKHDVISPVVPASKWYSANLITSCGNCHKEVAGIYKGSRHFLSFKKGFKDAPNCLTCHRSQIAKVSGSRNIIELKLAQEKLCLSCHLDKPEVKERTIPSAGFIASYDSSIHRVALLNGNPNAAGCVDCHTSHNVKDGSDISSTVYRMNIPSTCGNCHAEITKDYNESIHGVSAMKGNKGVPVCTDCHGEHDILKHTDPRSPVAFKNVSEQVCSPCHSSVKLSEKYGISTDRFKTFSDSYHGLALKGGSLAVANCASCHGIHNIKSSSDPTSMVNKANLVKTCGSCHRGANENFAKGKIHLTYEKGDDPLLYWISTTYIILIFTIVGGMFIHNLLDFIRKSKIKKLKQMGLIRTELHGHSLYLRMTLNERIQHALMALSFITLVITGFMLHFPDAWWVRHIRDLSTEAFEYRSLLHRIAAVVMIGISLYHIIYISATTRGRQFIKDLLPRYEDLRDAIGIAKFNLGLSKEKPKLDRFSYVEKAEYWALIWGTIVMSLTGIIMWFDNTFIGLFTKLGWDVARTIHYFEAWLAFLSIVVWHFYFVIFNPDVYPMNTAWLTGKIPEEEMKDEHPKEYERISPDKDKN